MTPKLSQHVGHSLYCMEASSRHPPGGETVHGVHGRFLGAKGISLATTLVFFSL